jgi:hypothetical protein
LEESEFYVADAQAMLAGDPTVALYVAGILARRLDVTQPITYRGQALGQPESRDSSKRE